MYFATKVHTARMKCHHCGILFGLTAFQLTNDPSFECPKCHKVNYGSTSIDNHGVIVGLKSVKSFDKIYC
jgi:hypothetical protein